MWDGDLRTCICVLATAGFVTLSARHQILAACPREETELSRHSISQIRAGAESGCWWHRSTCVTDCLPDLLLLELQVLVQKSLCCFSRQASSCCQSVNPDKTGQDLHPLEVRCFCLGDPLCCGEAFQHEGRCVLVLMEGICQGGKCHDGCR